MAGIGGGAIVGIIIVVIGAVAMVAGLVYYKKSRRRPSASSSSNSGMGDKVSFNNVLRSQSKQDEEDYGTIYDKVDESTEKTGNDYTSDPFGSMAGPTSSQQQPQQPYVNDNSRFLGSDA